MGHLFTGIYLFFREHRWAFILLFLMLLGFEAWFGSRIILEEDINKVIPATEKNKKLIGVLEHARFADRMIICISLDDEESKPAVLVDYANALIDSLSSARTSSLIDTIEGAFKPASVRRIYDLLYHNLPLFLHEQDYESIDEKLSDSAIALAMKNNYEALISPGGFMMKDFILKDPLSLAPIALKKLERLKISENYILHDDYIHTADLRNLIFFITPANPSTETSENEELIRELVRYREILDNRFGNMASLLYFGSMPVSIGNASQIKRDIITTVSIAIVLLIVFIGFYFRKKLAFLLLFLPAAMGGGFALAILQIFRTEVSAISLGLGSVMLGISVDYAIHFLSHLRHTSSVKTVIRDIAQPIMVSSLTTASAFLCLLVLKSEAMRDLGLFAALSVFSSALFTLAILPQFFREKQKQVKKNLFLASRVQAIASFNYHKKGRLVWLIMLLFVVFLFSSKRVEFESSMDSMNYMTDELTDAENYLDSISSYKLKSVYVVSSAPTMEQALLVNENVVPAFNELVEKGGVRSFISIHDYFPSASVREDKTSAWTAFWDEEKKVQVIQSLEESAAQYRFKANTFSPFYDLIHKSGAGSLEDLDPLREAFLNEYIAQSDSLTMITSVLKVREEDKPIVYDALSGYEELVVFDRQSLTSSFMEGLKDNFNTLIILSLLVVFLILTLSFGRIELGIITFIPLLISWVFTLGIMGLLGISFNIFNVVISTFIFGLGIDYAIFCMRGLLQEYQFGREKLQSYKTSILLSGITTLVGIGVLIFAQHPALRSIAVSAIIGITSVIFITYTLLPRLFYFLIRHEGLARRWPVTLWDFIFSINTFVIFFIGVIVLNISGLILKYLVPISIKRKKLIFHKMLSASCWIIVYGSFNVRKVIRNTGGEDFKKPAIIICNHQSHLDTVVNIFQNPRMILLTASWVQKSMFFGWFIRFADFYSVTDGIDPMMDKLRKTVDDGYSIFVFPEGTRSPNLEIGRFHQGAFHMAKELDLDIIPVVSYGSGNTMPKFEPFLKTSPTTMTILPRIGKEDPLFKDTPLSTAKSFRTFYKREYGRIRKEFETPEFFRKKVVRNYLFRGPVLEWYMKVKIRMEDNYRLFHKILPEEGLITDIGCGYGFMAYMLHLMAPGRSFQCFDHDADKIDTALYCALNNDNMEFSHADVTRLDLNKSDAFIIADVLHYLPEAEQEKLIRKCASNLNENGLILIRDADAGMKKKHLGTRLSEFLSTRIGFNATPGKDNKLYFRPKEFYLGIFDDLKLETKIINDTHMTSNLVYILKKKR